MAESEINFPETGKRMVKTFLEKLIRKNVLFDT